MSNFALYGLGLVANSQGWSSRIYATGSVSEATAAAAIHSAWDALWGDITAYLPTVSTLTQTFASTLNASWKFTTATPTSEDLAGTSASVSMPATTAPLIKWNTAQRTKSGRGRSFLPAAAVNGIDSGGTGKLLAAFYGDIHTGAAAFLSALTSAGLTPVVLNRATLTTTDITVGEACEVFRTQRRRQSKVIASFD